MVDAATLASPSCLVVIRYYYCGDVDDLRRRDSSDANDYDDDHLSAAYALLCQPCAAAAENGAAAPTPTSAGPAAAQVAGMLQSTDAPTRQPVANTTAPAPYLSLSLPQWW